MPKIKFFQSGNWADQSGNPSNKPRAVFKVEAGQVLDVSRELASYILEKGKGEIVSDKPAPAPKVEAPKVEEPQKESLFTRMKARVQKKEVSE